MEELIEKFKVKDTGLPTEEQYFSHDRRIQDLESEVSSLKISLKATQKLLTDHLSNTPATHYVTEQGEIYE